MVNPEVIPNKRKMPLWLIIVIVAIICIGGTFLVTKYVFNDNKIKNDTKETDNDTNDNNKEEDTLVSKIDKDKDYVYSKEEYKITDLGDASTIQDWMKNKTFWIKTPFINIDKSAIMDINNNIEREINDYKNVIKYEIYQDNARYLSHFITCDYHYYINNNILSLVIEKQEYLIPASGVPPVYEIHNIDLSTGKVLTNDDLLNKMGTDKTKVLNQVKTTLTSEDVNKCSSQEDSSDKGCYDVLTIDNESKIYLDKNNKINIVITLLSFENGMAKTIILE